MSRSYSSASRGTVRAAMRRLQRFQGAQVRTWAGFDYQGLTGPVSRAGAAGTSPDGVLHEPRRDGAHI